MFTLKAEALAKLPRTGYLLCRDTDTRGADGRYTGGKVFRACRTLDEVLQVARREKHLYEHVGHWPDQRVAPYLDVELLLRRPLPCPDATVLELYRESLVSIMAPFAAIAPEQVRIATAIAPVRVHTTPDGCLVKRKGAAVPDDAEALLFSFHVKVQAPGVYFVGNAQQRHFWERQAPHLAALLAPRLTPLLAGTPPPALFGEGWFDPLVYNERPWRMLYSAKISNAQRILRPWPSGDGTWNRDHVVAHMVTHVPDDVPSVLPFVAHLRASGSAAKRHGLLAAVTASMSPRFQALLLPHRLAAHVAQKQQVATHHWPPNAAAIYFEVPESQWAALEAALWDEAEGGALLAYCYGGRAHALQLDIDKCPEALLPVAMACHGALQALGVLAPEDPVAVEDSPPKADKPQCAFGRLTFPTLVVDEESSRLLKLCCAQACAARFASAGLAEWAGEIIDPQSRGARTHHSAKDGQPHRRSMPRGLWDGRERAVPLDRAAFCPLRPARAETLRLTAAQRRQLESIQQSMPRMASTASFQTVQLQGRAVRFSTFRNHQLQERALALWDVAQQTEHFRKHPFVLTYIYEKLPDPTHLPEYLCFTDCLHCPFRSREAVPGHTLGSVHTDHHILLVVTGRTVELRCNAKWHQRKTTQDLRAQTDSSWRAHYALLFGRHVQPPAAPCAAAPHSWHRFQELRQQLLASR